jgi:hypothetical protein
VSPGMGAGGSGDCHHYFPYPPWLSYAALPCPHGIDGAARGRKFDIRFLLIRIQTRFKILRICIASRHERVPTIPQRHAPIRRPMPSNRGGAAGVQLKRGQCREKIWKGAFSVCDSRNPLKFHKTAKTSFGNVWRKQADLEKLGKKGLQGRLCSAASAASRNAAAPVSKWRTTPSRRAPSNRGADRAHFDRDRLIKSPLTGMIQVVAIRPTASQSRTGV